MYCLKPKPNEVIVECTEEVRPEFFVRVKVLNYSGDSILDEEREDGIFLLQRKRSERVMKVIAATVLVIVVITIWMSLSDEL